MSMACYTHLIDAGTHTVNHFCGTHKRVGVGHALNNNQPAQLHLDGAAVISQQLYPENLQDWKVQMY